MKSTASYTIIRTFLDKKNHLDSARTGIVGGTEKEALYLFNSKLSIYASKHPRVIGLVLIDAAENVIAEWTRPVETERAA